MKIVSYNINGIRASVKAGLIDFIERTNADVYCFQEVRCEERLAREILLSETAQLDFFTEVEESFIKKNYFAVFNCGNIPGYAGTLTLIKERPENVIFGMGDFWQDDEGRTTTVIVGNIAIVNTYVPNGNTRLEFKMKYLEALNKFLQFLMKKYYVVCLGDFNIAHTEMDLTNPKECSNKSVFLPIEREAFSSLLNIGMVDTFRFLHPDTIKYSWRSYRSLNDASYNSWKYRIDYILASENLKKYIDAADILDERCSDHLPVVLVV